MERLLGRAAATAECWKAIISCSACHASPSGTAMRSVAATCTHYHQFSRSSTSASTSTSMLRKTSDRAVTLCSQLEACTEAVAESHVCAVMQIRHETLLHADWGVVGSA